MLTDLVDGALNTLAAIDDGVVGKKVKKKGPGRKPPIRQPNPPHRAVHPALHQIHEAQQASGLLIQDMERLAGVGWRYWSHLRRGAHSPSLNNLEALANTVGLTVVLVPMDQKR